MAIDSKLQHNLEALAGVANEALALVQELRDDRVRLQQQSARASQDGFDACFALYKRGALKAKR